MVCVGAAEGFSADFPSGTKHRSATASACGPEMRITARPPSPSGVAIAAMVSSSMDSVRVEKFAQIGKWWVLSPGKPEHGDCNRNVEIIKQCSIAPPLLGGEGRGEGER